MILGSTHVHYADVTFDLLDAGNGLYYANYLVLADRARGDALEGLGYPLHELWDDGYALHVQEVRSEFLQPVPAGAKLAVLSRMTLSSERTLTVVQQFVSRRDLPKIDLNGSFVDGASLVDPATIVCQMESKLACVNVRERRVVSLPTRLVEPLRRLANMSWPPYANRVVHAA